MCGYEVDALFERERVIVELDGWEFHNDRRSFERDRAKDVDTLLAGFVTVRITWERLHKHPRREAESLKRILASRASEPAPRSARSDLTPWLQGESGRSCSSPSSSMSTRSLKKHSRPLIPTASSSGSS